MARPIGPLAPRFWEKVDRSGDCWEWQAQVGTTGYGRIEYQGVPRGAHRVAWELTNGPVPDGLMVLHHCDNRRCVNPDHLYLGTHADNMRDMAERGRRRNGEESRTACPQGHVYDAANTYRHLGKRYCRACQNARRRERRMAGRP